MKDINSFIKNEDININESETWKSWQQKLKESGLPKAMRDILQDICSRNADNNCVKGYELAEILMLLYKDINK